MKKVKERACNISITTSVDGEETQISRVGSLRVSFAETAVCYQEENAAISLVIADGEALVVRTGDYSMRLPLRLNAITQGSIGVGGAEGTVEINTRRLAYSTTDDSLLLSLHYDLLFGRETQTMKIRLLARAK